VTKEAIANDRKRQMQDRRVQDRRVQEIKQDDQQETDVRLKKEQAILNAISQQIFDKKGINILAIDVRGISTITDYQIIAEGGVARHLKALSFAIQGLMKELDVSLYRIEGEDTDWIIMDYYDVIIHLMTPDMRFKYALEQLWNKGAIVDVDIVVPKGA